MKDYNEPQITIEDPNNNWTDIPVENIEISITPDYVEID